MGLERRCRDGGRYVVERVAATNASFDRVRKSEAFRHPQRKRRIALGFRRWCERHLILRSSRRMTVAGRRVRSCPRPKLRYEIVIPE